MIDPLLTDTELSAWYGFGLHPDKARRLIDEVRRLRLLVGEFNEKYPCDAGCWEYPEEECSQHGRMPVELWQILWDTRRARAELDEANEKLGRALAAVREALDSYTPPRQADRDRFDYGVDAAKAHILAALEEVR